MYHPIPELRYVTRLDIVARSFALCVQMVCVRCEGCVRRCGVSALCLLCIVYSLQQYKTASRKKENETIKNCFCYQACIISPV